MWSFCHPGGSETEQASSGAMAERECFTVSEARFSFGGRHRFLFWQRKENGVAKRGPMRASALQGTEETFYLAKRRRPGPPLQYTTYLFLRRTNNGRRKESCDKVRKQGR